MGYIVALLASLSWGSSDYLGGHATRKHGALKVVVWSQGTTFIIVWLIVLSLAIGNVLTIDLHKIMIAAAGGIAGSVGVAAFYRALALGPMVLVPPLASVGVVIPVVIGLARGAAPSNIAILGVIAAIVGVVLASFSSEEDDHSSRISPEVMILCFISALGFACVFMTLDYVSGSTISGALLATAGIRVGSIIAFALACLFLRANPIHNISKQNIRLFMGIGVLDTSANLAFAIATTLGRLEVVAILGSLYPAVTSGLAATIHGDRIGKIQLLGIVLTLMGVAAIAGG